jgi:predicted NAD/FAD-dependent oxidoreductase
VFDHAAQYFTVSDPVFQKMVDQWESEGLVKVWDGRVGNLRKGGQFTPLPGHERKYVGTEGMMGLADRLGEKVGFWNIFPA